MWWGLIEKIALLCAEEMVCEKEMVCGVRGYHVYKDIWAPAIGEVLVCSREPTNVRVKLYIRLKKVSYVFRVGKYFYNRITVSRCNRYTHTHTHTHTAFTVFKEIISSTHEPINKMVA